MNILRYVKEKTIASDIDAIEIIPEGERLENLNVEVILSPEEAATGIRVPIGVLYFIRARIAMDRDMTGFLPAWIATAKARSKAKKP